MFQRTNDGHDRIRVLFLSDHLGYSDGVTHGATTYFMNVLPSLNSREVKLTVCFLRERHDAARRLEAAGIHPVFLNRRKWDPRALLDLVRIIRERDIHIVHAAGMKGILLGRIAARLTNRRAIIHLHDTKRPGALLAMMQRLVARWADLAVVVSQAVSELAVESLGIERSRVVTMHNPVDLKRYRGPDAEVRRRVRRELDISPSAPVIGVTSRLSDEKGHCTLINVMPEILARCPEAVLLIAGDGPKRDDCEAKVASLGLDSAVRFLGNRSDIPDILAAVDVVALPSSREGLPYSALEAMAAGRPIVSFAVGGMVELLCNNETGVLVPAGDGSALAQSLVRILSDQALSDRLSSNARVKIRDFSVGSHVTELKVRYQHLLHDANEIEGHHAWSQV